MNKTFGCGDHSPDIFHRLIRTGEGVGNGESFQISCVLHETEKPRGKVHGSEMDMLPMQVPHVNAEMAKTHGLPISSGEIVCGERTADDVQLGHEYSGSAQPVASDKQLRSPRSTGEQWAGPKRL